MYIYISLCFLPVSYWIEPHCVTANQSRAHHWAALCNSQSEQSSSLSRTVKQPIRAELNIEPHCVTANQSRVYHWAAQWNSQSEQSSSLSRTVKQPIRAELIIEPHSETANQSRAHHWAAQWNSQSEQSSTLLFITLPHKPITDRFILGRNPRVLNGHVKPFLENFCPCLRHTFYVDIREKFKILYQCILWHILRLVLWSRVTNMHSQTLRNRQRVSDMT